MITIKELEADMILAKEIKNEEWITQLDAKLEHTKKILRLIDERLELLEKAKLKCNDKGDYLQGYQELMELKIKIKGEI